MRIRLWGDVRPYVMAQLESMVSSPDLYINETENIDTFTSRLIETFRSVSSTIVDKARIDLSQGYFPTDFKLYKEDEYGNWESIDSPPESEMNTSYFFANMKGMEPGTYKIVYNVSESVWKNTDTTPLFILLILKEKHIRFTFE